MAPPVAQRLREGHAPTRAGARRRAQSGPHRRRAEPARLPGRLGRPSHPFRQRSAAYRTRDHGRIFEARPAANIRSDHDLHLRRRRDRGDRPRFGHRRRPGGRRLSAQHRARRSASSPSSCCSRSQRPRSSPRSRARRPSTVLERSERTALTSLVTQALFKARENAEGAAHADIPAMQERPRSSPRSSVSAPTTCSRAISSPRSRTWRRSNAPFVYLGSQFFSKNPAPHMAALQARLKAAYPETEFMALETGAEPEPAAQGRLPHPLPLGRRLRHHRHRQAAHRHSGRRARPAFEGRAQVWLGKERRADQLLHHAQPGAGAAHQRRTRGRRDRRLARPQGVRSQQPAARPRRGRHVHPSVEPGAAGSLEGPAARRRARPSATRRSTSSSSTPSRSPSVTRRGRNSRPA